MEWALFVLVLLGSLGCSSIDERDAPPIIDTNIEKSFDVEEKTLKKFTSQKPLKAIVPLEKKPSAMGPSPKAPKSILALYSPQVYVNEKSTFAISYFGIGVGFAYLETLPLIKVGEELAIHYKMSLKSSSYYSYLYKIHDSLESFVGAKSFLPLKYKLVQRESSQDVDDLQLFDHAQKKTFFWYRKVKKGKETKKYKEAIIPDHFQDYLSSTHFIRGLPLKVGDAYEYFLVSRAKTSVLKLKVRSVGEPIEVMDKEVPAICVALEIFSLEKSRKTGEMTFWYSHEPQRRPLRFRAKVKLGRIKGEVVEFTQGHKIHL